MHSAQAFIVVVALVIVWMALLEQRALWDPDEGRYAEIAREMARSGDWITPRLNDLVYLEKPPLQYWATVAAFKLFGEHNWTARLWPALAGLACVFLTFYAARRLHSSRAGAYAALALGSSVLYFSGAHFNTLDAGVTFFMSAAVFFLAIGLGARTSADERPNWIRWAWLAAGLAFMSKGMIGIVLPAGALIVYALLNRDYDVLKRAWSASGAALMLIVTVPWIVAAARANPDFLQFFFIHEHFARFAATEHRRYEPAWFFLPLIAFGALPWTAPFVAGLVGHLRRPTAREFDALGFLGVWCVVVFVFFSASGSKLPLYIMPIFPALAVLGGAYMREARPRSLAVQLFAGGLVVAIVMLVAPHVARVPSPSPEAARWAVAACATWIVGCAIALFALHRGSVDRGVVALAATAALTQQGLFYAAELALPQRSGFGLSRLLAPYVSDATPIYSVGMYSPSLSFYLGRTVTLVEFRDEFDLGLGREPEKGIPTREAFAERWLRDPSAVAVMRNTTYRELDAKGLSMHRIAQDTARVAVRRP